MTGRLTLLVLGMLAAAVASAATPDANQYGSAYLAEGENEAAVKSFAESLRVNPGDAVALNNMGVAKSAAGDYQAALDFLTRAHNQAPNRLDIKENLSNLQNWARAYSSGVASVPLAGTALIPEPPALWSAAGTPAQPALVEQIKPTCSTVSCK